MFSRYIFIALLFVLIESTSFSAVVAQTKQIDDRTFKALCEKMRAQLSSSLLGKKIPGATATFAMPDGRSCAAAAGMTDISGGRKLAVDDPILAGSIGKTFIAALALQLVEEGKLDINEKISRWLGTRDWFARLPNSSDITVRMLLNHTSGIPDHVDEKNFFSMAKKNFDKDVSYDYLLTFILNKKPLFPAGSGYSYADTNYILLAMIEEQIAGTTMYDEVTRRFLKPFRLDHTLPATKNIDAPVHGFYDNTPVVKNGKLIINPQWEWAGGGFWSTSTDLANWARALYGGKALKKASVDEMIRGTSVDDGNTYGLGVEIVATAWGKTYGHGGEWPGYLSIMRYYPKFDAAIALQYNAGGTPEADRYGVSLVEDLATVFLEAISTDTLAANEKAQIEMQVTAWLRRIDKRDLAASWDDISKELKAKFTREAWPIALKPLLSKAGAIKDRRFRSIVRIEADLVTVDLASSFSKAPAANETVVLKNEQGKWRVSSYSIH